ncbi:MAG: aminoglycoside phosphotransferase [Pseudomonadota bacterium]
MTTNALPPAANADHLTAVLRKAGALRDGRVRDVAPENPRDTVLSHIVRLKLAYDGVAHEAPPSLILKTARHDRLDPSWVAGRQEVAFYNQVAPRLPVGLVPRCFEADWSADTNQWHLLLEDLTATHMIATVWPLPPALEQCEIIVGSLARVHAEWWDNPALGASVGTWLDADALRQNLQTFAGHLARFIDQYGDRIPLDRRQLYDRLIEAAPRLRQRYLSHRNVTIAHGDAHVWNCLLPRDPESSDARLFDWDSWHLDAGTSDLAYMIAMHWYPDRRGRFERHLLDRYHRELLARGIENYDRRALADDYRLSVLLRTMSPVWQAAHNIPPVIWWNNMERIFLAADDLDCRELLG